MITKKTFRKNHVTKAVAVVALALVIAGCGGGSGGGGGTGNAGGGKTLNLWLGGVLTTSTPGSDYRVWVDDTVARFKQANPGTDVKITLLPADNDQLAAKVQGAFASKAVPDVMMLYSGAYTTAYASGLESLTSRIKDTPGMYDSMSGWDLSCTDFDCQGGSGTVLGVPADMISFFLFYNKNLLSQAGISGPPQTWDELLSDCGTLKAKNIVPMAYGDQEGYTTVNFLAENLASYLEPADMQGILSGSNKLTDPKVVAALDAVNQLRTSGCSQQDASTQKQLDAINLFSSGKAAMVEMYAGVVPDLAKGIGTDNLGVTVIPGSGPLGPRVASNSGDNWVIPSAAKNKDLAWKWIQIATDQQSAEGWTEKVNLPTANIAAAAKVTDPLLAFIADKSSTASLVLLDSVLPNGPALYLYKQLNLTFSGQMSSQDALASTQQQLDAQGS